MNSCIIYNSWTNRREEPSEFLRVRIGYLFTRVPEERFRKSHKIELLSIVVDSSTDCTDRFPPNTHSGVIGKREVENIC